MVSKPLPIFFSVGDNFLIYNHILFSATFVKGQSMNLGLECNNVYLPIFVWTFTVNDVEYSVTHQFPVW